MAGGCLAGRCGAGGDEGGRAGAEHCDNRDAWGAGEDGGRTGGRSAAMAGT